MFSSAGLHVITAIVVTAIVVGVEVAIRGGRVWKRARPQSLFGARAVAGWIVRLVWFYGLTLAIGVTGIYVAVTMAFSSFFGAPSGLQIASVAAFATTAGVMVNVTKDLLLVHRDHHQVMDWVNREGFQYILTQGRKAKAWRETFLGRLRQWKDLDLLVVTGMSTLGAENALLAEYLQRPHAGRLRVLLLDPDSEEFAKRAAAVGCEREAYKKATEATIARLQKLQRRKSNAEYRFYSGKPIWRVYMGGGDAFIQHAADNEQDASRPIYGITKTDATSSLYPAFEAYFETMWENSAERPQGRTRALLDDVVREGKSEQGSGLLNIRALDAEAAFRKTAPATDSGDTVTQTLDLRPEPDPGLDQRTRREPRRAKRLIDN